MNAAATTTITCELFRAALGNEDSTAPDGRRVPDAELEVHLSACPSCDAWMAAEDAVDETYLAPHRDTIAAYYKRNRLLMHVLALKALARNGVGHLRRFCGIPAAAIRVARASVTRLVSRRPVSFVAAAAAATLLVVLVVKQTKSPPPCIPSPPVEDQQMTAASPGASNAASSEGRTERVLVGRISDRQRCVQDSRQEGMTDPMIQTICTERDKDETMRSNVRNWVAAIPETKE